MVKSRRRSPGWKMIIEDDQFSLKAIISLQP